MRATLAIDGAPEAIIKKAVNLGIARSKTEAIREGNICTKQRIFFNKRYRKGTSCKKNNVRKSRNETKRQKIFVYGRSSKTIWWA